MAEQAAPLMKVDAVMRGKSEAIIQHKKQNSIREGVFAIMKLILGLVLGGAFLWAASHVNDVAASTPAVNGTVTSAPSAGLGALPNATYGTAINIGKWHTWYLVEGIVFMVMMVGWCCVTCCTLWLSCDEDVQRVGLYKQQERNEEADAILEENPAISAKVGTGGLCIICDTLMLCPVVCFSIGWWIYGLVLFMHGGWTEVSKWFIIFPLIQCVGGCCLACCEACTEVAQKGDLDDEEDTELDSYGQVSTSA